MTVKQISVFLENKGGQLTELTNVLAESKVNLQAINIAETTEYGIARIIVEDVASAVDALIGSGMVIKVSPVEMVAVPDEIGGLNKVLQKISAAGIGVEYMYSIISNKDAGAKMIFKVDKPEEFKKII